MRIRYTLLKLSLTSVLGMALLAGACSEQGTQPEQITVAERISAPNGAQFSRGGSKKVRRVAQSKAVALHAQAEVDASGGLLQAENYFLYIPAGAVREKTRFTMDIGTDGVASLEATVQRGRKRVDVGASGFRETLTLGMYYGDSPEALTDEPNLEVAWVVGQDNLSTVPSMVNTQYKVVYGQLEHFSQYALATPRDDYSDF